MSEPASRRSVPALAFASLLLLPACTVSSKFMTNLEAPEPVPVSATQATVVFLRPSSFGYAQKVLLLDQDGRFLGDSWGWATHAVQMPPGHYTFVSWTEGTHALQADLAAGRVYYVHLSLGMGAWRGRLHLMAMSPDRPDWAEIPGWLAESRMTKIKPEGQKYCDEHRDGVKTAIEKGLKTFGEYSPEEKAERTLRPGDGVPAPIEPKRAE